MRIALYCGELGEGGAERVFLLLADAFAVLGYSVDVLAISHRGIRYAPFEKTHHDGVRLLCFEKTSAMSMALACISTDCETGPSEMIRSGENGLLVPVRDVEMLSDALGQLMSDESLRLTWGDAARADVLERFNMDSIVSQWEALLL